MSRISMATSRPAPTGNWTAAGPNVSRSDAPQRHGDLKCRQDSP
jgi:hypothetical protein